MAFDHRVASPDALWHGLMEGTVRLSVVVRGQTDAMQQRIREAFDRRVREYERDGGLDVPVSVKLASARVTGGGPASAAT